MPRETAVELLQPLQLRKLPFPVHRPSLPIDEHLAAIAEAVLVHRSVIVEAPPGTGKTTRVAPALLERIESDRGAGGLGAASESANRAARNVLLLQPRRVAARAAAARIARELGCPLGDRVGYQVRFDRRTSDATRLICMTPGVLLRRLQRDPILEDVQVILLDEFHERSLEYDMLLGMLQRIQQELRSDLRCVIMSATLDGDSIREFLVDAPTIHVEARTFPIRIEYQRRVGEPQGRSNRNPIRRIVEQTSAAVLRAMSETAKGDMLVFLPGVGEIRQVESSLQVDARKQGWSLWTLYGDMRPEDQDAVLQPSSMRRIILATNIAETSLTIEGVQVVVDSGWARVQRADPVLGLNRLLLEPISQASADQRAGRAGRTGPGVCYRLWDEVTGRSRPQQLDPEILRVDLSGAALQLLCWGEADLRQFPWITPPHSSALSNALDTLQRLDAIEVEDADLPAQVEGEQVPKQPFSSHSLPARQDSRQLGRPTAFGRRLLQLPLEPRIARLMLAGVEFGIAAEAAIAAAILSERDVVDRQAGTGGMRDQPSGSTGRQEACDLTSRVVAVQAGGRGRNSGLAFNSAAVNQVQRVAKELLRHVDQRSEPLVGSGEESVGERLRRALLAAFPDRVARRRSETSDRGVMVGGRGVRLGQASQVRRAEFFLCLDVDARGSEAEARMASGIEADWLTGPNRQMKLERFFNPTLGAIVTRRRDTWCDLVLSESPAETPLDETTAAMLAEAGSRNFDRLLPPKDKALRAWLARARWLSERLPDADLPAFTQPQLARLLAGWCFGLRTLEELKRLPWSSLLPTALTPEQQRMLETQAPESVTLPSGRRVLLEYEPGKPPVLAARIQEFLGWRESPRIAGGRVPLQLHLLAPNGRVQQITDDLASFWANTYASVRKDLRGRYPKHAWPEDPLAHPSR